MGRFKSVIITIAVSINILYLLTSFSSPAAVKQTSLLNPLPQANPSTFNFGKFALAPATENSSQVLGEATAKPINVLLLGLDGRIGDSRPRCDAIHMISFDPDQESITITSVPRGTPVNLPGQSEATSYLSNTCHTEGFAFAISEIEKITGIEADAVVRVGFSQVLGILRVLNFPTTGTLQYLRSRQYAIGDNQRSRNQAQFLKDMMINHLGEFLALPRTVQYIAFRMLDTDLDFEQTITLLKLIDEKKITRDPGKIVLITKPLASPYLQELHFSDLPGPGNDWTNDADYQSYQNNLRTKLTGLITRARQALDSGKPEQAFQIIQTPFKQDIWAQLDDPNLRDQYHFDMLEIYVKSNPDKAGLSSLVLDFQTETEETAGEELKNKSAQLISSLIN